MCNWKVGPETLVDTRASYATMPTTLSQSGSHHGFQNTGGSLGGCGSDGRRVCVLAILEWMRVRFDYCDDLPDADQYGSTLLPGAVAIGSDHASRVLQGRHYQCPNFA